MALGRRWQGVKRRVCKLFFLLIVLPPTKQSVPGTVLICNPWGEGERRSESSPEARPNRKQANGGKVSHLIYARAQMLGCCFLCALMITIKRLPPISLMPPGESGKADKRSRARASFPSATGTRRLHEKLNICPNRFNMCSAERSTF